MSLLKTHEAVAIAAVLQTLRDEGALPVRRPSWEQPTYWSRPITITEMPVLGPAAQWVDMLTLRAPVQYISVVTGYIATTATPAATSGVEFQMLLDGALLPHVTIAAAANLFQLPLYPLQRRPTFVALAQNQVLSIQARNLGIIPRQLMLSFTGWSYDTINIERGSDGSGSQGVTDD